MTIKLGHMSVNVHVPSRGIMLYFVAVGIFLVLMIGSRLVFELEAAQIDATNTAAATPDLANQAPELHELIAPDR